MDPSGRYLYVTNIVSANVSQYTIGADGSLTAMTTATIDAGTDPVSVKVHPSGSYAYAANLNSNNVSQYTIGTDGSLIAMTTPTVAAGTLPRSITVDPSGSYAYVANQGSDNVNVVAALIPPASPSTPSARTAA